MMMPRTIPIEALRHEMTEAVKLIKDRLAHVDPRRACLSVDFVFRPTAPRIFPRRELDYPVFKSIRKIPVAEEELVGFAVPPDKSLRLRAADGRVTTLASDSDDRDVTQIAYVKPLR